MASLSWGQYIAMVFEAAEAGVEAQADHVLDKADPNVPYEFGPLVESRTRTAARTEGNVVSCIAGYGNPDDKTGEYAGDQHENMSYSHPGGKTAKYLENATTSAFNDLAGIFLKAAADRMR